MLERLERIVVNQIGATAPCTRGARTAFLPALAKSKGETSKCAYAHLWEKRVSALTLSDPHGKKIRVPVQDKSPLLSWIVGVTG